MVLFNEIAEAAKRSRGIFRTKDLDRLGINAYRIRKMIESGLIERFKSGYYRLIEKQQDFNEASLVSQLFPDGVLCMHTALFHYGYSDRVPLAWDIAINKDTSKSRFKLNYPYVQPYYLEPHLLAFGVTRIDFDGYPVQMFDRDRLICECIFYESKMDREVYNKAIQAYVKDPKKNVPRLLEYSKERRILKKLKNRIGVWL